MINKIKVIPNSGIYNKSGKFFLINTMKDFFIELEKCSNKKIEISAILLAFQDNHYLDEINHKNITFNTTFKYSNNKIINILNYIKLCFSCFLSFFFNKQTFYYAFFPGNISLINVFFAIIFKNKFGLYVRGDINKEGYLKNLIYNFAIKKAQFCLVTGQRLLKEISLINNKTEAVSAMINYKKNDMLKDIHFDYIKQKFRFLYVGRVSKDKGIYDLLKAFINLKNNNESIELVIIGNVALNESEKIIEYFKTNSNSDIIFKGAIKDSEKLRQEYLKSDCFVLSSHHEGFPRVLYEAMIFNIPIITSDLPGIRYEMIHNENCIKYPIADKKSLTAAMSQIIKDESLKHRIRNGGNKFMTNYFKKQTVSHAEQIVQMINKHG